VGSDKHRPAAGAGHTETDCTSGRGDPRCVTKLGADSATLDLRGLDRRPGPVPTLARWRRVTFIDH